MTDEWEIVNFNLMFEQQLARDYMQNPNPEYAKHLLELAAAHKTNSLGYPMSDELKQFLIDCAQEFATNFNAEDSQEKLGTKARRSFGLVNKMGRPSEEQKQIVKKKQNPEEIKPQIRQSSEFEKKEIIDTNEIAALIDKAKEEFQRFIDYFPGSEYYTKAKEALKQLSVN